MNKRLLWAFGLFLIFATLSAATFWDVLLDSDQVLAFNDANIEPLLSPSYNYPNAFIRIWDNQTFFGMGMGQVGVNIASLGETIFGPHHYRKDGQAIILALCGLAFYWMARQYRFHPIASALTGSIIILSGWCNTSALSGLPVRPVALAFAALALGFMERGRQTNNWLTYPIAGGCLGLAISEVPDVGALLAIASAFIFFWTHLTEGRREDGGHKPSKKSIVYGLWSAIWHQRTLALKFSLYVAFSALLGWQTITSIVGTQIQGVKQGTEESPDARYAWATQWSIPPAEIWNTVSGNYFGSSIRSETSPYWGRIGRSDGWETTHQGFRNFAMTGWHLGVVPCILLTALFIYMFKNFGNKDNNFDQKHAKIARGDTLAYPLAHPQAFSLMLFLGSIVSIMLMWGKYFPLYRFFWSLPFINTFRNPDKWNGPFMLFATLGIAFILDILLNNQRSQTASHNTPTPQQLNNRSLLRSSLLWAGLSMAGISLVILIGTAGSKISFINNLIQEGYKDTASIAYDNAINACLKVLILSGLFSALVAFILRGQKTEDSKQLAVGSKKIKNKKNPLAADSGSRTPDIGPRTLGPADLGLRTSDSKLRDSRLTSHVLLFTFLAILSIGDLYFNNRPYVLGHFYKHLLQPNPLSEFLDAHRQEGRIKLLPPQNPLLNNLRQTLLQSKGYDLFDPISISRMPTDYEALFNALGKQPIRLWELGSFRYFLTLPGAVDELNKLDGNRGRFIERLALGVAVVNQSYVPASTSAAAQRYLRVVEFIGALPKYRLVGHVTHEPPTPIGDKNTLRQLATSEFNLSSEAILQGTNAEIAVSSSIQSSIKILLDTALDSRLEVTTDQSCLLIRSVKYDLNWEATLDGEPTPLHCANYLLQGVVIPPGSHTVFFNYKPPLRGLTHALATRSVLIALIIIYMALATQKSKEEPT